MPLPSWMARPKFEAVPMPIHDSPANAPGWRILDVDDNYTCVWPADYTPDPAAVAYLQAFYPDAVPIFRRQLWMPPNSHDIITAGHWCVGRYIWNPHMELIPFHCELRPDAVGPAPNYIDYVAEDPLANEEGGPGPYEPFDMQLAHRLRRAYSENEDAKSLEEFFRKRREARAAAILKHRREMLYRWLEFNRRAERILPTLTPSDWAAYRARNLERRQSKPFVHVQGVH